jgi:hypothetical protein
MSRLLPTILAGSFVILMSGVALADNVPQLNVDQSCRAAGTTGVRSGSANQDDTACKRDEEQARDKLQQGWSQFGATDRAHCVRMSTLGGSPSYVELLTCLELAKQANALPSEIHDTEKQLKGPAKP